jgi:predicted DNA-binding WGR domain protein
MPSVTLHRIDLTRNMRRFYQLDVQPDLFGAWGVVREWGRIGRPGRLRVDPYPTAVQAEERMQRHQATKQGRGYRLVGFTDRTSGPLPGGRQG